ncbi:MAG: ECF transporter S component [Anaeroplasma sp.]
MKKNKSLYLLTLTAVFSALSFVGTMINVPMPSGGMVHLGNFVMILAGLLCGGIVGGLSGSLGMGLYDIFAGYAPSTYIRSFVLKFAIGFIVGELFKFIFKKKYSVKKLLFILSGLFLILGVLGIVMIANSTDKGFTIEVFNASKTIAKTDLILAVVFSFLFFTLLLVAGIISFKLSYTQQIALFATTIGMLANMILELGLRILLTHTFDGVDWPVAYATALAKIPASILTSFITVLLIAFIYTPIYKATKNYNLLNNVEVENEEV